MTARHYEFQPETIRVPGKPLGRVRLVNWSEVAHHLPVRITERETRWWAPNTTAPLDQQDLGACTGFAVGGTASTEPYGWALTAEDCRALYHRATQIDAFPGEWPPTDTGSTGLSAFEAAVEAGYFTGCAMAGGPGALTAVVEALQTRPGALGLSWYDGMDEPAPDGQIRPTGRIRGGHEVEVLAVDMTLRRVYIRNSWGEWGLVVGGRSGYAWLSFDDLSALLESDGDATFPEAP